jgi:hypothetical protein
VPTESRKTARSWPHPGTKLPPFVLASQSFIICLVDIDTAQRVAMEKK